MSLQTLHSADDLIGHSFSPYPEPAWQPLIDQRLVLLTRSVATHLRPVPHGSPASNPLSHSNA